MRPSALDDHVDRFNRGVRTADFSDMVAHLADDVEMIFVGVPVGPFSGRRAVAEAYAARPPDDEMVVLDRNGEDGETVVAGYAWRTAPAVRAGTLELTVRADEIARLVVTFAPG